jgi:FlaG/FlaF family flagellin (archaellin)
LKNAGPDGAVSEVVGEMLMVALVLLLISVFSASLSAYLPIERSPSVTVMMSNDTYGNITIWHKGGDSVKASDLKIKISKVSNTMTNQVETYLYLVNDTDLVPPSQSFGLGSNITVDWGQPFLGNEKVVLATDRAVIFSGVVGSEPP